MNKLQPEDGYTFDDDETATEVEEVAPVEDVDEPEDQQSEDSDDSESAPDKTPKEEAVEFNEKQQEVFNKAIAEKVHKRREAERKAEKLEKELAELKAKLPQQTRPELPQVRDPLALNDAEFADYQAKRDKALQAQAAYDAQQQFIQQQDEQLKQRKAQAQDEARMEDVKTYSSRAVTLGVKADELEAAGKMIYEFGIDPQIENYILQDSLGPLITKYLSKNPTEIEALNNMPPLMAAVKIATDIKQKASALKPKVNTAPDPIDTPSRSGSAQKKSGPVGATFE